MGQTAKKRYTFRQFEFWAHYGKIALLDTEQVTGDKLEGDCIIWLSPKDFLERAMAYRALMIEKYNGEGRRFLEMAKECAKEAYEQGDISDPEILRRKQEELRPVKVFIPSQETLGSRLFIPGYDPVKEKYIRQLRKYREMNLDPDTILKEGLPKEE